MYVGIFIFEQAEVLDFSGPYEVFLTASRISGNGVPFNVFMVGEIGKPVSARGGYTVLPNCAFSDHPAIDVLIVVGGVHTGEMETPG